MTEQFAFLQIRWNRRAVQLDKWASAALTGVVNSMSNEFFSCAGFPLDEDSGVCGRNLLHLVEDTLQSGAIANDPIESTFGPIPRRIDNSCTICHKILLPGTPYDCCDLCSHIKCSSDRFEQQLMIQRFP